MKLKQALVVSFSASAYGATVPIVVPRTDESGCQDINAVARPLTCWDTLGLDIWFDNWKNVCSGTHRCGCGQSQPWAHCLLGQGQNVTQNATTRDNPCVDLKRPDLCQILSVEQTKLSKDHIEVAYISTAISNLFDFVHYWYRFIVSNATTAAVSKTLSDYVENPLDDAISRTRINVANFLSDLMTNYSSPEPITERFVLVMRQVLGSNATVDVATMDIVNFQNSLGRALGQVLNATLANWNNTYFRTLSRNGILLGNESDAAPRLSNNSLAIPLPSSSFNAPDQYLNRLSSDTPAKTSISRTLLSDSADVTQTQNFLVYECDASTPGSPAEHLTSLLDAFHHNLWHVMKETIKGPRSQLGFTQLFQTAKWIPIRRLYEHMFNAVGTRGNPAANQAIPDNRPSFICLSPNNPITKAPYALCAAEPRLRAFQQPGAPYAIGLCPAFWALPSAPVRVFCPWHGAVGEECTGNALQLNQQSVIVHQLVRIYLGDSVLVPEVFSLKDVLDLGERDAYWNPSTWAYWFASVIGCTPQAWHDPEL